MSKLDEYILNIEPTAGYLIVKPLEAETKTASGIYLPDTSSEKPQKGEVLVVGSEMTSENGAKNTPPCKKGDIVIYKKWGGNEVKIGSTEYLFVKFEDILGIQK